MAIEGTAPRPFTLRARNAQVQDANLQDTRRCLLWLYMSDRSLIESVALVMRSPVYSQMSTPNLTLTEAQNGSGPDLTG